VSVLALAVAVLLTSCANRERSVYDPLARQIAQQIAQQSGVGAGPGFGMPGIRGQGGYLPIQPRTAPIPQGLQLGIDVLARNNFDILQGKRVGLVCHQPSVAANGTHTRMVLHRAPQVNLVALYTPEHGLDGKALAGRKVSTIRDSATGLTAYSLYADTRKPTKAMLAGIDVLVVDLQDIGSRSYTYISTMGRCLEACGESGKEMIVLDRPNPLGGMRVHGPPLERRWRSFVGEFPVPFIHGMTMGELAMMAHGEGWMKSRPKLQVVKMQNWDRRMSWEDTRLRWVPTSPNIPHASSSFHYAATGVLGGAHGVDIGIGTETPFGYAGARGINANSFVAAMKSKGFHGVWFSPYSRNGFSGARITISKDSTADLMALDCELTSELNKMKGGAVISGMAGNKLDLFNKVYGSDSLANDLRRGRPVRDIVASWQAGHAKFRLVRRPYLLYPEPQLMKPQVSVR